jgi:Halocarboxylic acid dehydrogenase DehI
MPEKRGKLNLVREREAQGRTREIFDEVRHSLRVPGIPILYQAYAAFPEFLDLHWRAFKPLLASGGLFSLADRLRGEAYTRVHNYFQLDDLCGPLDQMSFSSGAKNQLGEVIELFNFKDAPVLLMASTQLLAFDQAIAHGEPPVAATIDLQMFREKPVLVEENVASPEIKRIYDEMKRVLGLPVLNSDYQAFARWPDFLAEYWRALKPIVQSPAYREQQRALCESSEAAAKELQLSTDFGFDALENVGLTGKHIEAIVRTTRILQNVFSGLVLNVSAAKIGFEGGTTKITEDHEFAA